MLHRARSLRGLVQVPLSRYWYCNRVFVAQDSSVENWRRTKALHAEHASFQGDVGCKQRSEQGPKYASELVPGVSASEYYDTDSLGFLRDDVEWNEKVALRPLGGTLA